MKFCALLNIECDAREVSHLYSSIHLTKPIVVACGCKHEYIVTIIQCTILQKISKGQHRTRNKIELQDCQNLLLQLLLRKALLKEIKRTQPAATKTLRHHALQDGYRCRWWLGGFLSPSPTDLCVFKQYILTHFELTGAPTQEECVTDTVSKTLSG